MEKYLILKDGFDIETYFQAVLGIAGTLLGLAFAAFTFVLQDGFQSFKYNRVLFLKIYIASGKKVLYTLSYIVFVSLLRLFFIVDEPIYLVFHILFSFIFMKTILDHRSHWGYIYTLFSNKFIPERYGKFRSYFRKIKNLGFIRNQTITFQLMLFVIYPLIQNYFINKDAHNSDNLLVISTFLFLVFSIFYIARFIPEFFNISITEYENSIKSENPTYDASENVDIDYVKEKTTLKSYLETRGYKINIPDSYEIAGGKAIVNFLEDKKPEAWFNITIHNMKNDPIFIRRDVEAFAVKLFSTLNESECDINSFALSFHIDFEQDNGNIFFRLKRSEMKNIDINKSDTRKYISLIKNSLFDDMFRDM
jgi:hypothetical protein